MIQRHILEGAPLPPVKAVIRDLDVISRPRHPTLERSSTAQTKDRQLYSPGNRPITLTRRLRSPKVRSSKLVWRIRSRCSTGKCR